MGNILAFMKQLRDGGLENIDEKYQIFLDFENENLDFNDLREDERDLAEKIEEKLKSSQELLTFLQEYGAGGRKFIVEASANVTNLELQNKAWENLLPMIANLQKLKNMTDSLNQEVPEILDNLWGRKESRQSTEIVNVLKNNIFFVLQLGKILDYNMRFDALKMNAPSIPNDISYVKRQITIRSKKKISTLEEDHQGVLRPEALAEMSKYYIEPTPALKNMIEIIKKFFDDGTSKDEPLDLLVSFSKVCTKILDSDFKGKYQRFGTVGMLCRIMVATTLLYDHLHSQGVFVKDSPISIKLVVDILEEEAGLKRKRTRSRIDTLPSVKTKENGEIRSLDTDSFQDLQDQCRNLLSVLKYSNKHLKTNTTPRSVEQLFNQIF